jgi:hypothetical protein
LSLFIAGGQNVLLAYLLAPLWEAIRELAHLHFYDNLGRTPGIGIVRSFLAATIFLSAAALLKDRGMRLRL